MKKNNFFLLLLLLCYSLNVYSQGASTNVEKYWRFRERLKNFLVTGNCFGCSVPAKDRTLNDVIEWSDATIHMGYYIGMLATENKVLQLYDQQQWALQQNVKDLFYALEAMNRLDRWAEYRWEEYEFGINHNGQPPPMSDLNGFFIRDDIPKNELFFNQLLNGKTVRELLNSSWFALPDGYHLSQAISAYTVGIDEGYGPREETIDQVIQLYIGLALVSKLIDPSIIYIDEKTHQPVHFMDGETSLLQEAKNISNRITGRIQQDAWKIVNPVMPGCTQGVCGNRSCLLGACGGGNATGLCFGFYRANCFIQQQGSGCNSDAQTDGNSLMWATTYRWQRLADQDFKVLTLAAIGSVWDGKTDNVLVNRCIESGAEHLPLLYNVLYDSNSELLPDAYYLQMLNEAWCTGNNGYEGPLQWRGQSRLLYGANTDPSVYQNHYSNIDYMIYLNLYILTHPSYLSGNYQSYLPADLCDIDIIKNKIQQKEQLHLQAANKIELSDYTLSGSSNQKASLTLRAGKSINIATNSLFPLGTNLTASIDPSLKVYNCQNKEENEGSNIAIPFPSIEIIPNPNNGNFFLLADHLIQDEHYGIAIRNAIGQQVFSLENISEGIIQVNLSNYASGFYIVSLESRTTVRSKKIIVAADPNY